MSAEYDFWDDEEDLPPIPEGFEPVRPPAPVVPKTATPAPALELPPIPEGFEPVQPPQAETATAPIDLPPIPEGFEPVPTPVPVTSVTTPAPALEDHPAYHTKDETVRPTDDLTFKGQRYLKNKFGVWNATTMGPVVQKDILAEFDKRTAAKAFADQALFYQKESLAPPTDYGDFGNAFVESLGSGNAKMSGHTIKALGEFTGDTTFDSEGDELIRLGEELSKGIKPPRVKSYKDIGSLGDFIDYAQTATGQAVGSTVVPITGGIAGGYIGSRFGGKIGGRIGAVTGAFGGSELLNVGSMREALIEEGVTDPKVRGRYAVAGGTAMSILDTALPAKVASRLTGSARREVERTIIRRMMGEAISGAKTEGLTEAGQDVLKLVVSKDAAGKDVTFSQVIDTAIESGLAGALGGGAMSGATGVIPDAKAAQGPPPGLELPPELGGPARVEPQLFPDAPPPPAGEAPGPVPPPGGPTPPPTAEAPVAQPGRPSEYDFVFTDPDAAWADILGPGEAPPVPEPGVPPTPPVQQAAEAQPAETTEPSEQLVHVPPPGTAPMAPRQPPPAAPIPPPGFVETRNQGERYHGTAAPIGGLDEGHYESLNYYGQGFYTSDAFDITDGYSRKGRRRAGPGAAPTHYKVEENEPVNAFDMEQPIPDFLVQPERDGDIYGSGEIVAMALDDPDGPKTVRELYDYVREYGTAEGMTADTIQEQFESFRERLMENGYGAIDHIGGLRTGRPEHKVRIYLDPANQVRISTVNPEGMRAQPVRRISFEAAPGEGSPYAARFGEAFSKLHPDKQARVTRRVTAKAAKLVERLTGHKLTSIVHGTGGWQHYQNPAAVSQTVAPREVVEAQAAALGYLLQQTEVWVNHLSDQQPNAHAVDFMEIGSKNLTNNERLKELWQTVSGADTSGLIQGFQPITDSEGNVGIRVLVDQGGPETRAAIQQAIPGIVDATNRLPYNIRVRGYNAGLTKLRNDWTQNPDGQDYLGRLASSGYGTERGSLDSLRGELETEFANAIGETEERATRPAPEVIAARKRLKGLELLLNCVTA